MPCLGRSNISYHLKIVGKMKYFLKTICLVSAYLRNQLFLVYPLPQYLKKIGYFLLIRLLLHAKYQSYLMIPCLSMKNISYLMVCLKQKAYYPE